jgi:hypothetical protein
MFRHDIGRHQLYEEQQTGRGDDQMIKITRSLE